MRSIRVVFGVVLLLALSLAGRNASASPGALFQKIRKLESSLGPLPPETSHLLVGTMDCTANGSFKLGEFPSSTSQVSVPGPSEVATNQTVTQYQIGAFAKHVHMRFNAINRHNLELSAKLGFYEPNGSYGHEQSKKAQGKDDFVEFDIGEASGRFTFSVTCGKVTTTGPPLFNNGQLTTGYRDPAHCPKTNEFCNCPKTNPMCPRSQAVQYFNHSHFWADGGAFMVEAVPVAVIYDPPVDNEKKSYAEYIDSASVGSSASLAYSSSSSQQVPVTPPEDDANQTASALSSMGGALTATGNPYAMAVGGVLSFLSTGLGSTTATETKGSSTSSKTGVFTRLTASSATSTAKGADLRGPGDGDYIHYYHHAYYAWEAENSKPVHSIFIGADVLIGYQVFQFKADLAGLKGKDASQVGAITKLHKKTIESLLKLDPFASGGPSAALPPDRFRDATSQIGTLTNKLCHGPNQAYTLKVEQGYTQGTTAASFKTDTTQYSSGFLSFLNLGITQDQTIDTSVGVSRAQSSYQVNKQVYKIHLNSTSSDTWCTKIYFDKLFGTFAFQLVKGN